MATQEYNPQLIEELAVDFPRRKEPGYAWGNAIAGILNTPKLRAFWPASSVDETGMVYDLSGQGRHLTQFNTPTPGGAGLYSYADFVRANSEYYQRITEPGLEIEDALTLWTWVKFDAASNALATGLISKYWTVAPANRSYILYKAAGATNAATFLISTDGVNSVAVTLNLTSPNPVYGNTEWYFFAGRFTPSTELMVAVGVGSTGKWGTNTNVAAIPATINVSTEPLDIGRHTHSNYLDGKMSLWGIANYALPDITLWNMFQQTRPLFRTTQ